MSTPQTVIARLATYDRQIEHEARMRDRKLAEGKPKDAAIHQEQINRITARRMFVIETYRATLVEMKL